MIEIRLEKLRDQCVEHGYGEQAVIVNDAIREIEFLRGEIKKLQTEVAHITENGH